MFRYRRTATTYSPGPLAGPSVRSCEGPGLEGYRHHDARHAHASVMLRQGIPHKVVQERLGHAGVGTTLDIYSHVSPGMQKAAALRFQEVMAEARVPEPIPDSVSR